MIIEFYKPKSQLLNSFMEGYYFLNRESTEPPVEYLTFPNNYCIVSVYRHLAFSDRGDAIVIKEHYNDRLTSQLICHYQKPIKIIYEGAANEITFYFKPLGINAFLRHPLQHYLRASFAHFIPYEDYEESIINILEKGNREVQRDMIEAYWLSKYSGQGHPFLKSIITYLQQQPKEVNVGQLATKYRTSRKHIHHLFQKHLGKSPSDFRNIQRFRQTLSQREFMETRKGSLTELAYENFFYDQSHLIKAFKSFTGYSPKAFFRNISLQENGMINWLYL